jgi:hypothetical protein
MEPRSDPTNTIEPFPFTPQDWAQTPLAVQAYVRALCDEVKQLHDCVETLAARLQQKVVFYIGRYTARESHKALFSRRDEALMEVVISTSRTLPIGR